MRVFGRTVSYWHEKYGGTLYGVLAFILFLVVIKPEYYSYKELIQEFPSIGMCAFGFMLTFLGIILQGDSSTIQYMKSRQILYDKFIAYNKIVVILSLIISIYSYVIGYVEINTIISSVIPYYSYFKNVLVALFWGLATKLYCDAIKMGPGESSRSHKKDEFVFIDEIADGIKTYIEFIKRF